VITEFDDFAVHQAAIPINQPGPSDRNFYDRYWFNGFDHDGACTFEAAFGIYPNRFVQDGHFAVSIDGVEHAFHGSRRAPKERKESAVGPLRIEVVVPLRVIRIVLESNDSGLECDLTFKAVTCPTQEPENRMYDDTRLIMHATRFTQFGAWEGHFSINGKRTEVRASRTHGTRDRSWGIRPVGEPEGGAPGKLNAEPGVYWTWIPIHFEDICTHFGTFEDVDGQPTQLSGCIVPRYASVDDIPRGEEPGHLEVSDISHKHHWETGTRRPARSELHFTDPDGGRYDIELEPMIRFYLLGIGYHHPDWGHGHWKGELATGHDSWSIGDIDPLDYKHIHVHTICRARMQGPGGMREGVATVETLCFGSHAPSGFKDILDGAP
jgi:hypothetical protein